MSGNNSRDLESLKKEFGLTEAQLRYRLIKLEPIFDRVGYTPKRVRNKKILLCNEGLEIFRRAMELENQGLLVKDIIRVLSSELSIKGVGYPSRRELRDYENKIRELEARLKETKEEARQERTFLKEEIKFLREQNEALRGLNEDLREMLRRRLEGAADNNSSSSAESEAGAEPEPTKEEPPTS